MIGIDQSGDGDAGVFRGDDTVGRCLVFEKQINLVSRNIARHSRDYFDDLTTFIVL
jgi:hypothetical protein